MNIPENYFGFVTDFTHRIGSKTLHSRALYITRNLFVIFSRVFNVIHNALRVMKSNNVGVSLRELGDGKRMYTYITEPIALVFLRRDLPINIKRRIHVNIVKS